MLVDDVRIQNPCHEDWSAMDGAGARRYCGACERHVHDLSAMTESQARSLVQAAGATGERLCVRYSVTREGSIRFAPPPPPAPTLVQIRPRTATPRPPALARAGLAAALLAACTPHADDAPPCKPSIVGHDDAEMVGKLAAPELDPPPVMGEAPPIEPPIEPPPSPPQPEVTPVPMPLMGALAAPEPPQPPPEPTRQGEIEAVKMGDVAALPGFAPPPPPEVPVDHGVKMGKIAAH